MFVQRVCSIQSGQLLIRAPRLTGTRLCKNLVFLPITPSNTRSTGQDRLRVSNKLPLVPRFNHIVV